VNTPARTDHHRINIPGGNLTPDEAEQLAWGMWKLAADIRRDQAAALCATEGHQLWRANAYRDGDLSVTLTVCRRPHCGHHSVDPGHTDNPDPESDLEGRLLLLLHALNVAKLAPWPTAKTGERP